MSEYVDEQGRLNPPTQADEASTLLGFLEYQRATLRWKCSDLDDSAFSLSVAASSITLGGLVKHMALVEDWWFSQAIGGGGFRPPFDTVDWDADRDWEWKTGPRESPAILLALWESAIARSRATIAAALETGDLGQTSTRTFGDGNTPSLRWILCHMIEEYARHNGHADLIRESIDGLTGE